MKWCEFWCFGCRESAEVPEDVIEGWAKWLQDSGEEEEGEGGVIKSMTIKEALMQVNLIIHACYHA